MQTVTYTYEELLAHKAKGVPQEAIQKLRKKADDIISSPIIRIIDNKIPRPSGDLHDYVSMGPYWWPNPDTTDGLPFVNRDGEVNPQSKTPRGVDVYNNVHALALAELYIGGGKYAEYAVCQLYDWFINPETKINPHATYAQGIPGICKGRGTGLIDFGSSYNLFNAIAILENLGFVSAELLDGIREWFISFTDWILTHEYGLAMDNGGDNHASWHDANILATAVFTNRPQLIKNICTTAYERRVKSLIKPDGSQPSELRRTKGIGYSFFNLRAQLVIANIAERLGYTEYWTVDAKRGNCVLKSAVDFIYPYVCDPSSFPYKELYPGKYSGQMASALLSVAKRFSDENYLKRAENLAVTSEQYNLEPVL